MSMVQPLTFCLDTISDSAAQYIGTAAAVPGNSESSAVWKIQKIAIVGGIIKTLYPNGDPGFNYVWNNRLAYTYSNG